MTNKRDYYEVLGLPRTSSAAEIRSAYRKLAAKYHPDVNPGDHQAEERFKELNEAHEILSSAEKRQMYDQYGHTGPQGGMGGDGFGVGDIFDMFFGAGTGRSQQGARGSGTPGADLRYDLEITLEEAASGVDKTLEMTRAELCDVCTGSGSKPGSVPQPCTVCKGAGQVRHVQNTILGSFSTVAQCANCRGEGKVISDPCSECRGQGRVQKTVLHTVHIPAGVDTGQRLVDQQAGDAGSRGGPRGDLYVVISVQKHAQFKRNGNDLLYDAVISFGQAALGTSIEIPILGGSERLTIPEGTQPGKNFKLRGKGMPDLNSRGRDRGDEIVRIVVNVPTKLSEEQRKALMEFSKLMGEETAHADRGLLDKVKDVFTHK